MKLLVARLEARTVAYSSFKTTVACFTYNKYVVIPYNLDYKSE